MHFVSSQIWNDPDQDKKAKGSLSKVDSSVRLMHHDPSDLGSLILIQIIPAKGKHRA